MCLKATARSVPEPLRIAVLGGTFDPVHDGHVSIAREALACPDIDRVVVVPASVPSFKQGTVKASVEDRLEMCRLAFRDLDGVIVSDAEASREGVSYTSDTAEELRRMFPDAEISFLIGSDAAWFLPEWNNAETLAESMRFHILRREGSGIDADELLERLSSNGFEADIMDADITEISSTEIRVRLIHGRDVSDLLPENVIG